MMEIKLNDSTVRLQPKHGKQKISLKRFYKTIMKMLTIRYLLILHVVVQLSNKINGYGCRDLFTSNPREYSQKRIAFSKPIPEWIRGTMVRWSHHPCASLKVTRGYLFNMGG